jgi:hypothetical protein
MSSKNFSLGVSKGITLIEEFKRGDKIKVTDPQLIPHGKIGTVTNVAGNGSNQTISVVIDGEDKVSLVSPVQIETLTAFELDQIKDAKNERIHNTLNDKIAEANKIAARVTELQREIERELLNLSRTVGDVEFVAGMYLEVAPASRIVSTANIIKGAALLKDRTEKTEQTVRAFRAHW